MVEGARVAPAHVPPVLCSGFAYKMGGPFKRWTQKRFFELTPCLEGSLMLSWRRHQNGQEDANRKGIIITSVMDTEELTITIRMHRMNRHNAISRVLKFDSNDDFGRWVKHLLV